MPRKKRDDRRADELTTREALERLFHPEMVDALEEAAGDPDDPTPDKPSQNPTRGT